MEENKDIIIAELEKKNNNLVQQLYQKEREVNALNEAIEEQRKKFEHTIANLVLNVFGN